MSNPYVNNTVCQPVGMGGKTLQLNVPSPLDMRRLKTDLRLLFRSQGYTVYITNSPNILILQLHTPGIRAHFYTVKICQQGNQVLVETGITNGRVELERAGVEGGIAGVSDLMLHSKFLTLLSGAFAGMDVASVLGSYQQENQIIQEIEQTINSYFQQDNPLPWANQGVPYSQGELRCPRCGNPVKRTSNFCSNCGYKLAK